MRRWRIVILAFLVSAPLLFLAACGIYFFWAEGHWHWAWWPLTACLAVAYILAWRWQKQQHLLRVDFTEPMTWTDRDKAAWKLVQARAKGAEKLDSQKLSDAPFYLETAQDMAQEMAAFYHPGAKDPVGNLTVPEILAVIELAAHDLAEMVDKYLPGGHLLTINAWRRARQATELYQDASHLGWLISSMFTPISTSIRFLATQVGVSTPWQMLQQNILLWFYTAFIHRLGTYLIDLNSGRLRVGAKRFRELMAQARGEPGEDGQPEVAAVKSLTLVLAGQVKVGKSSLINAILGEQKAKTAVLPETTGITRYQVKPEGIDTQLFLLDTPGYGHTGPREDQLHATQEATRQADVILLVLQAKNPARQADVELLQALKKYFDTHPDLKVPPILGVMTHIDLLSPALEWNPPYNWQQPKRLKEKQIDQAMETLREQLGDHLAAVVPVCTQPEKIYGIQEWLLPALSDLLDEAHAVALLRCLRREMDTGQVKKVFQQFLTAGKEAVRIWWQKTKK
jgi:small GTP-binding protein